MIEYRLKNITKELNYLLEEMEAFIAEEEFKGEVTYVIYSDVELDNFLSSFGVEFSSKLVEETGWQEKWKEFIKEGWLNKSIYYIFEPKTFEDNRKTLIINPSLAFGTGTHGTTRIAAALLEDVAKGRKVLDVGCGSAILAISASILGAASADAFDIDEQAIPNALENIANNNCINVKAWAGDIANIEQGRKYGVVCANIISSVLLLIHNEVNRLATDYIVYSGILQTEYELTLPYLLKGGWKVDEYLEIDEWCGVRLKKW